MKQQKSSSEQLREIKKNLEDKARRKLPAEDVEDLVQDVLVSMIAKNEGEWNQIDSIKSYAEGILRNKIYDYYQKKAKQKYYQTNHFFITEEESTTPEEKVYFQRQLRVIEGLSQENVVDQALLINHFMEERSLKEVAEDIGVSQGSVNGRLFRFRQKILDKVGTCFVFLFSFGLGLWSKVSKAFWIVRNTSFVSLPSPNGSLGQVFLLLGWLSYSGTPSPHLPKTSELVPSKTQVRSETSANSVFFPNSDSWQAKENKKEADVSNSLENGTFETFFEKEKNHPNAVFSSSIPSIVSQEEEKSIPKTLNQQPTSWLGAWFSQKIQNGLRHFSSGNSAVGSSLNHSSSASNQSSSKASGGASNQSSSKATTSSSSSNSNNPNSPTSSKPSDVSSTPLSKDIVPTPNDSPDTKNPKEFYMKQDGSIYRKKSSGWSRIMDDIYSSFSCGVDESCDQMIGQGPSILFMTDGSIVIAGEGLLGKSVDGGFSFLSIEKDPKSLVSSSLMIVNQKNEMWRSENKEWKKTTLPSSTGELFVKVSSHVELSSEGGESFTFRWDEKVLTDGKGTTQGQDKLLDSPTKTILDAFLPVEKGEANTPKSVQNQHGKIEISNNKFFSNSLQNSHSDESAPPVQVKLQISSPSSN